MTRNLQGFIKHLKIVADLFHVRMINYALNDVRIVGVDPKGEFFRVRPSGGVRVGQALKITCSAESLFSRMPS